MNQGCCRANKELICMEPSKFAGGREGSREGKEEGKKGLGLLKKESIAPRTLSETEHLKAVLGHCFVIVFHRLSCHMANSGLSLCPDHLS